MAKVVHHESGKTYVMPMSGVQLIMSCGRWLQANYAPNDKRHTADVTKVTCKQCMKSTNMLNAAYEYYQRKHS